MNVMTDHNTDVNEILDEYAPLVRRIAKSACYSSATIDFADLCQVGEIAVMRAIKAYDPSSGTNIRSFVSKVVRQDIYSEAARFLGVFTVDHRVTGFASKVSKLAAKGHDDQQIADILNQTSNRVFDADHVRDLRIAYTRRQQATINEDETFDRDHADERTIKDILDNAVHDELERHVLNMRILSSDPAEEVARRLSISRRRVYIIETELKHRIKQAIEGVTE